MRRTKAEPDKFKSKQIIKPIMQFIEGASTQGNKTEEAVDQFIRPENLY